MASNSSGPASPLNVAEAEQLAAQFRPVWDVDDGASVDHAAPAAPQALPPPAPPAEASAASPPVPKPTMRWAPGAGPQGFPAPAPPGPLPAPAPRKPRGEAPTPEVRELNGDEGQVSSNGAVAMAVVSAPVLPPKASEVSVRGEPSIVVQDLASVARAVTEEDAEARRRQTIRVDDLRNDPSVAAMYAKYESENAPPPAPKPSAPVAAGAPARASVSSPPPPVRSVSRAVEAPLPEDTLPVNSNRKIVFGAVGAAALLVVLGVAKAALSGKDDPAPTPPVATATATTTDKAAADKNNQGASATGTVAPAVTAATANPTTTTTAAPSPTLPTKPTQTSVAQLPDSPTASPAKKETPKAATVSAPKDPPKTDAKKPSGKDGGGIVRVAPF